jgi:autotransporter translocation and assembly factor TamB
VNLGVSRKMLIGSAGILAVALLIYSLPVILLGETVLTKAVGSKIQHYLNQYELNCNVKKVRWVGGGRFEASEVAIVEKQGGALMVKADRLLISTDFWQLFRNVKNPETVLRKLEIIRPRFRVVHYANRTWNFSRFLGKKAKRPMRFSYKIKIRDGQGEWEDYQYGKHGFHKVDGEVDLREYPLVTWRVHGRTDFGKDVTWTSDGQARSDQASGKGVIRLNRAPLPKTFKVMGKKFSFAVQSGLGNGIFHFAWSKKKVWVQKGAVQIDRSVVKFPFLKRTVLIKTANARFTPDEVLLNSSNLKYQNSEMQLAGLLDIAKLTVKASMTGKRARVEDLLEMFPEIPNTAIAGRARFNLDMTGPLDNPVFDGKLAFDRTEAVIHGEKFTNLTGKLVVNKNNVKVSGMEGVWHEGPVNLKGTITNIFNPRLNLEIETHGVQLQKMPLCRMLSPDLDIGRTGNFTGKLTGHWDTPLFSGDLCLDRFAVREITAQNVKAAVKWEPMRQRLEIFTAQGQTWGGDLTVAGLMVIDATGMNWNLTGKLSGIDLKAVEQLPALGLTGEVREADAVFKGAWRYDTPFDPGTIMGVVRGRNLTYLATTADEASAVYRWQNGKLMVDSLQIKLGAGRVFGDLTWSDAQVAAHISAEHIRLGRVLAHEESLAALDGVFAGNITLEGGYNDFNAKIAGEFYDLAWEQKPIGTVRGKFHYDQRQKEVAFSELMLNSQTGDYLMQGRVNLAGPVPKLALKADSDNFNVKQFLLLAAVKPAIDAEGIGRLSLTINGTFANPDFNCQLFLAAPQIADLKLSQGFLEFNGDLNRIRLTKCELVDSHARVSMTGMVERDRLDLMFDGYCNDLESLELYYRGNLLKGRVDLGGKLVGSVREPVLTATLSGTKISFGELKYPRVSARIKWVAPELEIYETRLGGGANSISVSGKINTGKSLLCDLGFDVNNFQLKKLFQLANLTVSGFDGKFSGMINMRGALNDPQVRLNGAIAEGSLNSVPVTGEVVLSYGNDRLLFEKIGLYHSTGSFNATGNWEKGKSLRLRGRLNEFPLQTMNPWLTSCGLALSGLAKANVTLEWFGSRFKCEYQLESPDLQVNNDNWGSAALTGNMNEKGIYIANGALNVKNGSLELTGFIPWSESIEKKLMPSGAAVKTVNPLKLRMLLKNVPANLLNGHIPNVVVGSGQINGNFDVTGNLIRPEFSGKLEWTDGQLKFIDMPFQVDSIQAAVIVEKNHILINNRATGNVGKGRINLTGEVDFGNLKKINFNLDCGGSKVRFKNTFYAGLTDWSLKLAGTMDTPLLMGNITVYDAKVGGLSLTGNNKKKPNVWSPELDLQVKTGRKVRYRQIGLADVSVKGALHIKGNLNEPLLNGEITTNQGTFSFYGQTFKVNRGKAVFSYNQGFNPHLEIEASLPTQKALIYLKAKGQAGTEILPVLSSQPALSQKEIFALLNWSDLTGETPLTVDNVVEGNMGMVTDTLLGDVFYEIRNMLQVDYFYLETDYRSNEYRISAGDYFTDKLFISYTRNLVTSDEDEKDKWNFDYHFTPEIAVGYSYSTSEDWSWRLIYTFDF